MTHCQTSLAADHKSPPTCFYFTTRTPPNGHNQGILNLRRYPIIIHTLITTTNLSLHPAPASKSFFYCSGTGGGGVVFAPGGGMNKGRYVTAKAMTTISHMVSNR